MPLSNELPTTIVEDSTPQLGSEAEITAQNEQAESAASEQERIFSYTLKSGEAVSGTAEKIKELCPAMGALSLRQVEVMAAMKERGQQKIVQERTVTAEKPTTEKIDARKPVDKTSEKPTSDERAPYTEPETTQLHRSPERSYHTNEMLFNQEQARALQQVMYHAETEQERDEPVPPRAPTEPSYAEGPALSVPETPLEKTTSAERIIAVAEATKPAVAKPVLEILPEPVVAGSLPTEQPIVSELAKATPYVHIEPLANKIRKGFDALPEPSQKIEPLSQLKVPEDFAVPAAFVESETIVLPTDEPEVIHSQDESPTGSVDVVPSEEAVTASDFLLPVPLPEQAMAVEPVDIEDDAAKIEAPAATTLPATLREQLEHYIGTAEPTEAAETRQLEAGLIKAADHLHELIFAEQVDEAAIAAAEQTLTDLYDSVAVKLDGSLNEAERQAFLNFVRSEAYVERKTEVPEEIGLDEGTRERKPGLLTLAHGFRQTLDSFQLRSLSLGRFTVQASL